MMTRAPVFAEHHAAYTDAGWSGILPLPAGEKHAPPTGYTGADGRWPTAGDISRWAREYPDGNIALRLPRDVIGIDIDAYKNSEVRALLEALTGPLPPTWCSTSRVDGSGIRFYRVPVPAKGSAWLSAPVPAVEVIQHHHRYAVVAPSIHPEGRPYQWVDESSGEIGDTPPEIDDLTELPWAAIAALQFQQDASVARTPERITYTAGGMSSTVERRLQAALLATKGEKGSRHDAACRDVCALLRLAERGEPGVADALAVLKDTFVAAVTNDRPGGGIAATKEFDDIVSGAERKVESTAGRIPSRAEREAEWRSLRDPQLAARPDPVAVATTPAPPAGIELRWVNRIVEQPTPEPPVLIDGFMRQGEMLVLGAPRAIGKSWLAMNIATMLARGEGKLFGHLQVRQQARVLLCQGELDQWGSEQRWKKLTGTAALPEVAESFDRNIRVRTTKTRSTFTVDGVTVTDEHIDAKLAPALEQAIVEHGIDVVILDPWATYFAGNESSNDEVEAALDKLRGLTLAHGVSWVIFHHIGKATEFREPEDAWRGASRLADWASTRVTIMPHYSERQRKEKRLTRAVARAYADVFMLRRSDPTEDFSMHRGNDGWWRVWEPDDAEEALESHGGTTEAGGRPPAKSMREFINELASDGGEWESITVAADRLGVSRHSAQRLADHAAGVDLIEFLPGERRARRIVLTALGREKADRFVAVDNPEIESRPPVATQQLPEMCETLATEETTTSEHVFLMCETSDVRNPLATDKTAGQGQLSGCAKPPYYVGRGSPNGPPPYDSDEDTSRHATVSPEPPGFEGLLG